MTISINEQSVPTCAGIAARMRKKPSCVVAQMGFPDMPTRLDEHLQAQEQQWYFRIYSYLDGVSMQPVPVRPYLVL